MPLAYFITFTTYGTWLHGSDKGLGSVDRHHNVYGTPFVAPDHDREVRDASRMTDPPYILNEAARTIVRDAIVGLCHEKGWTLLAVHVRTNHVHVVVAAEREPGRLMSDLKARASRELNRLESATHEVGGSAYEPLTSCAAPNKTPDTPCVAPNKTPDTPCVAPITSSVTLSADPNKTSETASAAPNTLSESSREATTTPSGNPCATPAARKRWTRHGSTRYLFDESSVAAAVDYVLNRQGSRMAHYDHAAHEHTAHHEHKRAAHEVSGSTPPPTQTNRAGR